MLGYTLATLRAVLLLLHILLGLLIVYTVYPFCRLPTRNRINRWWSRRLLRTCGARLRVAGQPLPPDLAATGITPDTNGRLLLANHISWIDVFAIAAVLPCRFVAKAEIGRWPVLGALATRAGTLYIERGRRRAVVAANDSMQWYLKLGESVVVFPEGTTTSGDRLLPFHSNLLAPALETGCAAWPVALRYTVQGERSDVAAFVGETTLVASLGRILQARGLEIEVALLAPLSGAEHASRHDLARAVQAELSAHLDVPVSTERVFGGRG